MLKVIILALAFGIVSSNPVGGIPGAISTHTYTTSAHHGGYGGFGYPGAVVKNTEIVSAGYPGLGGLGAFGGYGYPGLGGLGYGMGGYGYPAAKAITQTAQHTTAVHPGYYSYY